MAVVDTPPLRRRVARLSWLTVALIGADHVPAVAGRVGGATGPSRRTSSASFRSGADDNVPSVSLILAAGAAAAAFFVGLAALHAAAAMRVLARDRRIPPPLSPEMRRLRSLVLDAAGSGRGAAGRGAGACPRASCPMREVRLGAAVAADGAGAGAQRGAHDRGDAGVVVGADAAPGQGGGRGRQLHRRHRRDRAASTAPRSSRRSATPRRRPARSTRRCREMFADIDDARRRRW